MALARDGDGNEVGRHVPWRFQGVKNSCWLTSLEMLMSSKYGCIYGRDPQTGANRTRHSDLARQHFAENRGSNITDHADHYGLAANTDLDSPTATVGHWANALRRGPVLAEGNYGWARVAGFANFPHAILITGVSRSGKLIYMNPNVFAVLPHARSKESHITVEKLYAHRDLSGYGVQGPFWQVREDLPAAPRLRLNFDEPARDWSANVRNHLPAGFFPN